jgi:uncharacterized protein (DUF1800 family)
MAHPSQRRDLITGLHRFGLGARPGDLATIGDGVRDVLRDEITRRAVPTVFDAAFATQAELARAVHDFNELERIERSARPGAGLYGPAPQGFLPRMAKIAETQPPRPVRAEEPGNPQRIYRLDVRQHVHAAGEPLGGFGERWVWFWANHFCVSAGKGGPVRAQAGIYEREVIRAHAFGRFEDMLLAAEMHPAMLIYLDNQLSIGPNSRAGRNRRRGLNENLAREILELHTLGVAGGYTQADVTSLARMLTGWMVVPREGTQGTPGTFWFNANAHEPGAQSLLGKSYPEGGIEQGQSALRDLARHPSTAQHVARKLARHFVADDPPPSLVARLAQTFRDTGGDLQALARTLIDAPESWTAPSAKVRSPQEFLVAAMRAFGLRPDIGQIIGPLSALGHRHWSPPGPNGYADGVADWASPEGMKSRLDVASTIARQAAGRVADPRLRVTEVLGEGVSEATRQAVARAESRPQALALLLMAPEFQRR